MNQEHIIKTVDPNTNATTVKYLLFGFRDFLSTGPHLEPVDNGQLEQPVTDMDTALHTIGYIKLSLYLDASGNTYVLDSNGNPINNRLVKSNSYTYPYPYVDNSGNLIDGFSIFEFDDNSTFSVYDDGHNSAWYSIYNVTTSIKQFT